MNPQNKWEMLIYRIQLFFIALLGELYKFLIDIRLLKPYPCPLNKGSEPNVIVSLTTYGRRTNQVYYTIISLLRQTYKPDMVILWLDEDNWSEANLPKSLLNLRSKGLTIKFCKDLKSYKKLIPSLQEYPNSIIVTCDDDIYYKKDMLKRLMSEHEKCPSKVIAHRAHKITFNSDGNLNSYKEWLQEISNDNGKSVFPTSGGGTLYKREFFHSDVCDEKLIMELAPKADDLWNYFMSLLKNTENMVLPYRGYIYIPLDAFYQLFHKNSNLTNINYNENFNDVQIKRIMNYYHLTSNNLKD